MKPWVSFGESLGISEPARAFPSEGLSSHYPPRWPSALVNAYHFPLCSCPEFPLGARIGLAILVELSFKSPVFQNFKKRMGSNKKQQQQQQAMSEHIQKHTEKYGLSSLLVAWAFGTPALCIAADLVQMRLAAGKPSWKHQKRGICVLFFYCRLPVDTSSLDKTASRICCPHD